MNKSNDFKFNLPGYTDTVDVEDFNDNFRVIDDSLMAGLHKKEYTGNNMGSSDPSARKYAWAPWLEIANNNEFDVVVTDRNAPVGSEEATINIVAGQTVRKYINGRYYMNFYVQDQHDVTFKWFTDSEDALEERLNGLSFVKISKEDFDMLVEKDPNKIYYVYDTNDKVEQYIGNVELSSKGKMTAGQGVARLRGAVSRISGVSTIIEEV